MFFFVFSRIPILPRRLAKGRFAKGNSECCQFSKEGERVLGEGVVDSGEGDIIEGLPPMPPTPLLEVLSMFQNQNLLRSILSVQGGSC